MAEGESQWDFQAAVITGFILLASCVVTLVCRESRRKADTSIQNSVLHAQKQKFKNVSTTL